MAIAIPLAYRSMLVGAGKAGGIRALVITYWGRGWQKPKEKFVPLDPILLGKGRKGEGPPQTQGLSYMREATIVEPDSAGLEDGHMYHREIEPQAIRVAAL